MIGYQSSSEFLILFNESNELFSIFLLLKKSFFELPYSPKLGLLGVLRVLANSVTLLIQIEPPWSPKRVEG